MNRSLDAVLRYRRTSLADGALGEGKFGPRDRNRFIELPPETLRSGQLPWGAVNRLFKVSLEPELSGCTLGRS